MNNKCPICNKTMTMTDQGVRGHLRKKDHKLTARQISNMAFDIVKIEPAKGFLDRDKSNSDLNKSLTNSLNRGY